MLNIKKIILFCVMLFSTLLTLSTLSAFAAETNRVESNRVESNIVKKNHADYRRAGHFTFISSIPPVDPVSGETPKEAENQVSLVFSNLFNQVRKAGFEMKEIVKITVYVDNRDTIMPIVDKVMDKYFTEEPYPARTPVTTTFGSKPYVISVDAIVYRDF